MNLHKGHACVVVLTYAGMDGRWEILLAAKPQNLEALFF